MIDLDYEKILKNKPSYAKRFATSVNAFSHATKTDPEMLDLLVIGSVAVPGQTMFDVMTHYDVLKPISVINLNIINSSGGKSSAFNQVMAPVEKYKFQSSLKFSEDVKIYKVKHKLWTLKSNGLEKKILKNPEDKELQLEFERIQLDEPISPLRIKHSSKEFTKAKFTEDLISGSISIANAEFGNFYRKKVPDIQDMICDGWDGSPPQYEKFGSEDLIIPESIRMSVVASMQRHHVLNNEGRPNKVTNQLIADGLWNRVLPSFPDPNYKPNGTPPYSTDMEYHYARITELMEASDLALRTKDFKRQVLTLSTEASVIYQDIVEQIESDLNEGGRFYYISGYGKKFHEHILRVAGNIHVYEKSEGLSISADHLKLAYAICERCAKYFLKELFYPPSVIRGAIAIFDWMVRNRGDGKVDSKRFLSLAYIQKRVKEEYRYGESFTDSYNILLAMRVIRETQYVPPSKEWDKKYKPNDVVDIHPSIPNRNYKYDPGSHNKYKEKLEF